LRSAVEFPVRLAADCKERLIELIAVLVVACAAMISIASALLGRLVR
jgi:hypothetical protein